MTAPWDVFIGKAMAPEIIPCFCCRNTIIKYGDCVHVSNRSKQYEVICCYHANCINASVTYIKERIDESHAQGS